MMDDHGMGAGQLDEDYWRALIEQGEVAPIEGTGAQRPVLAGAWGRGMPGAAAFVEGRRLHKGRDDAMWATLREWHALGHAFTAPVIGCNKGGLLVRVCEGLGFVPASQLIDLPRSLGTPDLRTDLESMVGRELRLRLVEVDEERDRVICSERATQGGGSVVEDQLKTLEQWIGRETEGIVRSVCDFGAFVDLGGVDGLIHISELSWQRVKHPSDIVAVDRAVRVLVLSVDFEGRRVALSLKRLHPDPWQVVGERYAVGDVIPAVVTNVVHFGAFARIDEGVEGLIHISELSDHPFASPCDIVAEGQRVSVRVLHIDPQGRRLGMSIRQA